MMTRHCSCAAQLQPHDFMPGICRPLVVELPPAPEPRIAVEFPVGHDWHPERNLLIERDPEDG